MKLKILSYNIHKGYDWRKKNYFLKEIKAFIDGSGADLVFLQEVTGQNIKYQKKGLVDAQFEFLADSLWKHFAYAKNAIYDFGHHGNLILSKYPIAKWENINLSTNLFEKRGLLFCKLHIVPLNIYLNAGCVHLNLLHRGRQVQYQIIKKYLVSLNLDPSTPLIIGGDFNDWNKRSADVFEKILGMKDAYKQSHGQYARTFPAASPFMCVDRIYTKNLKILNSQVLQPISKTHLSDHLPLLCEVEVQSIIQ